MWKPLGWSRISRRDSSMKRYIIRIPGWLAMIEEHYGSEVANRAEKWHDEFIEQMKISERYRYEEDLPTVRESIKEWREEMKDFERECHERKRKEDEDRLKKSKVWLEKAIKVPGDIQTKKQVLGEVKKLERRLRSGINQDDIDRAREYPVRDLLEVGRNGRAKCPFHNGEDFNADVRKNFVYCYVCSQHGDSIDVYRSIHNVGFEEAVKALS